VSTCALYGGQWVTFARFCARADLVGIKPQDQSACVSLMDWLRRAARFGIRPCQSGSSVRSAPRDSGR
jgi:hypothetical protein